MTKTKEDFLEPYREYAADFGFCITPEDAGVAMDEYAKLQAMAFVEYLREAKYSPVDMSDKPNWIQFGSKIGWLAPGGSIVKPIEHLYVNFLQSQQLH